MFKRFILVYTITTIFSILTITIGIYLINMNGIQVFEEQQYDVKQQQFENYIDNQFDALSILGKAHADWTDANTAVANENDAWLDENVTSYLVEGEFDIDYVYAANEDLTFTQTYSNDSVSIETTTLFDEIINENQNVETILFVEDAFYLFSGLPFANDDGSDKNGVFILGKKLKTKELDDIELIFGEVHGDHFELSNTTTSSIDEDHNPSMFTYQSLDDTLYAHVHLNYSFTEYIRSTVTGHSIAIISATLLILGLVLIYFVNRLNRVLSTTISNIEGFRINEDYTPSPNTNIRELDLINDSFFNLTERLKTQYRSLLKKNLEIVELLSKASELNDPYTKEHGDSVSVLSRRIGKAVGVQNLDDLEMSARLHDIGKVFVPLTIINKEGKLHKAEYDIVKQHPLKGYELLQEIDISEDIKKGILHHHERYDGKGYPNGLKGKEIPLFSRIISIADVYDALTSDRPYRARFSKEKAIEILLNEKGKHFDPEILDLFIMTL